MFYINKREMSKSDFYVLIDAKALEKHFLT